MRQQILIRANRLQVSEKIHGVLAVDLERVVLAQRQCLSVESEPELRRSTAQGELQGSQGRRQPFEVVGCPAVTEIDVVGDTGAAHKGLGLPADDDELHAVLGQEGAEAFKRALLAPLFQWPAPSARPVGPGQPGVPAQSAKRACWRGSARDPRRSRRTAPALRTAGALGAGSPGSGARAYARWSFYSTPPFSARLSPRCYTSL